MARIALENVSVHLPIYNARGRALKAMLLGRTVGGQVGARDQDVVVVNALDQVNLTLKDGDRLGVIGRNGAGKTTLLRVMGRIYPPTSGRATIEGRVTTLTDLMTGMDVEATGYENVMLRSVVMGLKRSAARDMMDEVVAFSELGEYMALPIRTYSSGMLLRLAFAISTSVVPDILILDELIGAGDAAFMAKAKARITALVEHAAIVVLASHDDDVIAEFTSVSVWMRAGKVAAFGPTGEVLAAYQAEVRQGAESASTGG